MCKLIHVRDTQSSIRYIYIYICMFKLKQISVQIICDLNLHTYSCNFEDDHRFHFFSNKILHSVISNQFQTVDSNTHTKSLPSNIICKFRFC